MRQQRPGVRPVAQDAGRVGQEDELLGLKLGGDGGGRAPALRRPMVGATTVARFLLGLMRTGAQLGVRLRGEAYKDASGPIRVYCA